MATTSVNLGLTLIQSKDFATTKYADYINKTAGDGVDSNMQKIDTAFGVLRVDENATLDTLNAHAVDTKIHVTLDEKKRWNETIPLTDIRSNVHYAVSLTVSTDGFPTMVLTPITI